MFATTAGKRNNVSPSNSYNANHNRRGGAAPPHHHSTAAATSTTSSSTASSSHNKNGGHHQHHLGSHSFHNNNHNGSNSSSRVSVATGRSRLVWLFVLGSVLYLLLQQTHLANLSSSDLYLLPDLAAAATAASLQSLAASATSHYGASTSDYYSRTSNGDYLQRGAAIPLPALPPTNGSTTLSDAARMRQEADGLGEPVHLGGHLDYEASSVAVSVQVMQLIRHKWGIRSLVDLGCGRGYTALWFHLQGVETTCVDGSVTAFSRSVLPPEVRVNHDFTRGPWWPHPTVDLVWSTGFVPQVSRQYMTNYIATMQHAAIVLVSFPPRGGWHHVEVHDEDWWIVQFQRYGLVWSETLTWNVQEAANNEGDEPVEGPDGEYYNAKDLQAHTHVFVNPTVAQLPAHAHLFPETGCFKGHADNGTLLRRECNIGAGQGLETSLPEGWEAPEISSDRHAEWVATIQQHLAGVTTTTATTRSPPVNVSHHTVQQIPIHIAKGNRTNLPIIPVVVWPLWEFGVGTAEALHMEKNGIDESPFLTLSDDVFNFHPDVVWVGDTGYAYGWVVWCDKFYEHVKRAQTKRRELGLPTSWPIYVVDWTDYPSQQRCRQIEAAVGPDFVKYSQRSITSGRFWNPRKNWVDEGTVINMGQAEVDPTKRRRRSATPPYKHTPLVVRTDTVENLRDALKRRKLNMRDDIETIKRPVDVTHLWPVNAGERDAGVGEIHSNLRTLISQRLLEWGASNSTTGWKVYVGLAGNAVRIGRRGVSSAYIEALLRTKIIVVTQRDRWEDHYRLFEALISGALVMTDRMLSLPAGLQNGTSVVEFGSAEQLRVLIDHYLRNPDDRHAVAREGRRIAMHRHRTWHRIEEIVFGRALTLCSNTNSSSSAPEDCPYIVHANETSLRRRR